MAVPAVAGYPVSVLLVAENREFPVYERNAQRRCVKSRVKTARLLVLITAPLTSPFGSRSPVTGKPPPFGLVVWRERIAVFRERIADSRVKSAGLRVRIAFYRSEMSVCRERLVHQWDGIADWRARFVNFRESVPANGSVLFAGHVAEGSETSLRPERSPAVKVPPI